MNDDFYSIKMRGASPVDHKLSGKHISGAEAIIKKNELKEYTNNLIDRALNHPKGESDFINISIQKIHNKSSIKFIDPLPITTFDKNENINYPKLILKKIGFNDNEINNIIETLLNLKNLKGALIISIDTFNKFFENIVRCSNMDYDFSIREKIELFLKENNFNGKYLKDALCLSSKILSCENIICEICFSDDINYTTGYIASKKFGYTRILNFKPPNHKYGGRIIIIDNSFNLHKVINYLQNQIVLINSVPKIYNKETLLNV